MIVNTYRYGESLQYRIVLAMLDAILGSYRVVFSYSRWDNPQLAITL